VPEIFGGSADLAGSNLTFVKGSKGVTRTEGGNYCYYGVREFGMTAIANGIALHGGLVPYTQPSWFSPTTPATPSAWRR
jgi:transketolase